MYANATIGRGIKNNKNDMKLYEDSDDELDLRKILMQHKKREVEQFASDKITENKAGFLQALNDPFCPPAMQFHNSKGQSKNKQKHDQEIRTKRKCRFKIFISYYSFIEFRG
jgi:hypothetical protein